MGEVINRVHCGQQSLPQERLLEKIRTCPRLVGRIPHLSSDVMVGDKTPLCPCHHLATPALESRSVQSRQEFDLC